MGGGGGGGGGGLGKKEEGGGFEGSGNEHYISAWFEDLNAVTFSNYCHIL